ncbi:MAG TPA: TolC family protein [Gemmataceae bacterium]|nr:TolC family protein [Gemmataceae bacterium]
MARFAQRWPGLLLILLAAGCLHPVREQVDAVVCDLAAHPLDTQPGTPEEEPRPMPAETLPPPKPTPSPSSSQRVPVADPAIHTASFQAGTQAPTKPATPQRLPKLEERVHLPEELPGGRAKLPVPGPELPEEQRREVRRALFPPLPRIEPVPQPQPGPFGHPLTLQELQQLAMANSPLLRQAAADVESARGAVKQAGAYPNPNFGYEGDTVGTSSTAGFQGVFFEQIIKTAGKLKVAEASALMNLLNSQLALRRAQTDLMAQVRGGYFAVLVAHQTLRWNIALATFTEEIYRIFVDNAVLGIYTPYEPLSLRALAIQARGSVAQAHERYLSAWKQLAAALGLPGLPLTEVAGTAEMVVPQFDWNEALVRVLGTHTDVLMARNTQQRARYDLRTAEITPIPDLDVRVAVQKDFTMPPFNITHNVQVGVPIPLWDQNRGKIHQAQGALLRATEEEHRVRDDLTTRLADAFERYQFNRTQAEYYRQRVLPDLALVYTRSLVRYQTEPQAVAFVDVVTNQQLYVTALATYAATLTGLWQAVTDVASLLQTDDLFQGMASPPAVPPCDLEHLPGLPCSHPCNPLAQGPADGCSPATVSRNPLR